MFFSAIDNCPHFSNTNFIDYNSLQYFSMRDIFESIKDADYNPKMALVNLLFGNNIDSIMPKQNEEYTKFEEIFEKNINHSNDLTPENEHIYFLCLSCGLILRTRSGINNHIEAFNHYIVMNLTDISIWCLECINPKCENNQKGTPIILKPEQISLIKNHIQYLREKKYYMPYYKFYTKEEIHSIKYKKFINNFKQNKFHNIIFMVGAGISTTAGIPDFRSETGLFKQLQDKYGMNSPEEFFMKRTFLEKPEFFYEFCKIFDLSTVKPTLTHKFMNYLTSKNMIKYVFTQNIDGLELKANIPKEKIIFAHGSFTEGHCPQCKISVDINKINKGIQEGYVVKCDICGGPCKPNVVFYGEGLGEEFYKKIEESEYFDLVFIMGTSLQVAPFCEIPRLMKTSAWKVVFNRDKVGQFLYNFLFSNTLFIQGTTDDTVKMFLKDVDLLDDFKNFVKINYGDENIDTKDNIKMMEVNELDKENKEINNGDKIDEKVKNDDNIMNIKENEKENENDIKTEMKEDKDI